MEQTYKPTSVRSSLRRLFSAPMVLAVGFVGTAAISGCARRPVAVAEWKLVAERSPRAMPAAPAEAWRDAQAHAATRAGSEVLLGLGESMQPLYRHRTLLVIERLPFASLRAGMVVVFDGQHRSAVAHCLLRTTGDGWQAVGLARSIQEPDLVTEANYRGVVTKAYELTGPR